MVPCFGLYVRTIHAPGLLPRLQAMANMAGALSRMGPELLAAQPTRFLLSAFNAHAASLPPAGQRPQEAAALGAALRACGMSPVLFRPPLPPGGDTHALGAPAAQYRVPAANAPLQAPAQGLRDATNAGMWLGAGSAAACSTSGTRPTGPAGCAPANPLSFLAGPPPPPQCHPGQQQHCVRMQQQYPAPPLPLAGNPSPPPLGVVLPLAGAPMPTISQYTYLAQQLAAAARAPSPHHLPQPVLVAPYPVPLPGAPGLQSSLPMQTVPAASNAFAAPGTSTDPAHLQRILQMLQGLKLQAAAAAAAGTPLAS